MAELDWDEYAQRRHLRPATLQRVRELGESSSSAVLALAAPLAMNDNNLRETLDLLEDIAARRQCSVADVLACDEVVALRRRDMGRSDRIRELKACLRRLRFPQLTAALERIDGLRADLRLPRGVQLELPDNLEGDEVTLTVRAASAEQLRSRVEAIASSLDGGEIDTIFSVWQELEG